MSVHAGTTQSAVEPASMKRRRALLLSLTVVLALCAACCWWLHKEQQQYSLNRQLIAALSYGRLTSACGLVEEGADPNTHCAPPPMPSLKLLLYQFLHYGPPSTNTSPTAFLLACGARWQEQKEGRSHWVVLEESILLLQTMLAYGADVHARGEHQETALHYASSARRPFTVNLLLQHGADINAQDALGYTPLMASASATDVTHLLLAQGADLKIQNAKGETALHCVVYSSFAEEVIPDMLAHGANPNQPDKRGLTPIQYAQKWKGTNLVRLLKGGLK